MTSYKKGLVALSVFCLAILVLAACQTTPRGQHLSEEQVAALKQVGFEQSDEGWEFNASDKLLFGTNEATLIPAAQLVVERIGRLFVSLGIDRIRVDGHTDATGSAAYNEQLSLRRATAVATALIAAGAPAKSIHVRGLGQKEPIASNQTPEGRMQNRRVVIVIVSE